MAVNPLGDLLSPETIKTIVVWGVLMQLAEPILQPLVQEISNTIWPTNPTRPLSPADAVDAALRGHLEPDKAAQAAAESGVPRSDFDTLLANAGEPLAPEALLEALRRGFIHERGLGAESTSFQQGFYESRIKNKWLPIADKLQWRLPDPGTVIAAWLRAQTDESRARDYLKQAGIPDEVATLMYLSAGRPPSPDELATMLHRGIIPESGTGQGVLSVQQGFYETDLKNKWWESWRQIQTYWPPPRTVTAMVREGALDDKQALKLFQGSGLSVELAGAYLAAAHHQKVQPDKELAKGDILTLYANRMIDAPTAKRLLEPHGYVGAVADYLLEIADFRVFTAKVNAVATRLRTLFVARKIDALEVENALKAIGAPPAHTAELVQQWTVEREAQVHTLSAAQWASAAFYQIVPEDVAIQEIEGLGWPAYDAWALVALRFKDGQVTAAPATPPPPRTASGA